MQTALKLQSPRIKISISYGRSTNYVEEYWIEDMEGKVIKPWDFPNEWSGKVFQLQEDRNADGNGNPVQPQEPPLLL